jgi:FMN phosphatase YigB (HAD superfamily)
MAWAGVDDVPFALVTTYENMHTCKPYPAYYVEIAQRIGVAPHACLMVGNDLLRDIAPARQAGMHTFLADEWIANPDPNITADRRGALSDFIAWVTNSKWQMGK